MKNTLTGELSAEFARHHDSHPLRRRRGGPGRHPRDEAPARRPRLDRLGVGHRRHARRLRRGPAERRPPQPGRDRSRWRLQGVRVAQGGALLRWRRRRARSSPPSSSGFTYADLIDVVDPRPHHQDPDHLLHAARQREPPGQPHRRPSSTRSSAPPILVFVIFALTTAINNPPLANLGPVVVGLLVVAHRDGVGRQRRLRHQPRPRLRAPARVVHHRVLDRDGSTRTATRILVADHRARSSAGSSAARSSSAHRVAPARGGARILPAASPSRGDRSDRVRQPARLQHL